MARSNLVPYAFVWEKGKPIDFLETIVVLMLPTSKKLTGHIGFRLSMRVSVRASVRSRIMHARVLKFLIWIPHGKIFDKVFFFCPSYLPFWSYEPLK